MDTANTNHFQSFCVKNGALYQNGFNTICNDSIYNNKKALNPTLSLQQYIQAASEEIYYYWLKRKYSNTQSDIKVNPPKDVDIFYNGMPFNIRIEVKTPEIKDSDDDNIIVTFDHRYDNKPRDESESFKAILDVEQFIANAINQTSQSHGKTASIGKLDDLKIKTFITEAQEKMVYSDDQTINILLICLDTMTMGEYTDYITNPYTGLATDNHYILPNEYDKIDFIVLSNCCEAHLDSKFTFNPWEAQNYLNFVIKNPSKQVNPSKIHFVIDLFDDKYCKFCCDADTKYNVGNYNIFILKFLEFIAQNYPHFNPNKQTRIY